MKYVLFKLFLGNYMNYFMKEMMELSLIIGIFSMNLLAMVLAYTLVISLLKEI